MGVSLLIVSFSNPGRYENCISIEHKLLIASSLEVGCFSFLDEFDTEIDEKSPRVCSKDLLAPSSWPGLFVVCFSNCNSNNYDSSS